MCSGAITLCAEQILSAYEFTVFVFYALQIILIVVLKVGSTSAILVIDP